MAFKCSETKLISSLFHRILSLQPQKPRLLVGTSMSRICTLALPAPPPYPSPVAVNPAAGFDSLLSGRDCATGAYEKRRTFFVGPCTYATFTVAPLYGRSRGETLAVCRLLDPVCQPRAVCHLSIDSEQWQLLTRPEELHHARRIYPRCFSALRLPTPCRDGRQPPPGSSPRTSRG